MRDATGHLPKIRTKDQVLKEILFIACDKRSHVLKDDCIDWLELKMKIIRKFARQGLAL